MNAPRLPVSTVRIIIKDNDGRILLLKRSNSINGNNAWCLPGGKIDYNQTRDQACKNEVKEETNLDIKNVKSFLVQDSLPLKEGDLHCINHYYTADFTGDVSLNDESSAFVWISEKDIKEYNIVFKNEEAILSFFFARNYILVNSTCIDD